MGSEVGARQGTDRAERLLEAESVSKSFPGVRALRHVSFELRAGEVHAIVGENGAGKSTFVKILTGLLRPDSGTVRFGGEAVTIKDPIHAEQLGISAIQQELAVVPGMDVAHQVMLGHFPTRTRGLGRWLGLVDKRELYRLAREALGRVNAETDPRAAARELGTSQVQLILLARALSRRMRLLILDEPTAALTPAERDELFSRIRQLQKQDVGILYVSHHLDEVLELADRVTVFRDGRLVATVSPSEVTVGELIELILARSLEEMYPKEDVAIGPPVLEVRNLVRAGIPNGLSLTVRAGEILGVTGLVGAGKSELARAIAGADPVEAGEIRVAGTVLRPASPSDAIDEGIALVPEDRKSQGLILPLSVRDNVAVAIVNCHKTRGRFTRLRHLIMWSRIESAVKGFVDRFGIRLRDSLQAVGNLSGGNQQKVGLSKCLATDPRVIILDEPTRGIDVGTKVEIYRSIQELAKRGVGILMMSSEPEEVIHMSDRILIMRKGRIVAELDRSEAAEPIVMQYATAGTAQ